MEYMRNFKWPSIYRVACTMYLWNLHFSIVSETIYAQVTFEEKPQIKIFSFQNGKHGFLMQYLIRQSFKGYCCESEYILFLSLSFSLGQCNAMQCRMYDCLRKGNASNVLLKEPPPWWAREGGGLAPLVLMLNIPW